MARGLITSEYGTDYDGMCSCVQSYGYGCSQSSGFVNGQMNPSIYQDLINHLNAGYKAILLMGGLKTSTGGACRNSYWSQRGHYICAYGISGGSSSGGSSSSSTDYTFTLRQFTAGARGNNVLLVQRILKARGIYAGTLDGCAGDQTIAAIRKYQQSRSSVLAVDGVCGTNTYNDLLGTSSRSLKEIRVGSTGLDVLLAEEILKAEGIYNGALDRSFGNQLYQAVRQAQSNGRLTVDGVIGCNTWRYLVGC